MYFSDGFGAVAAAAASNVRGGAAAKQRRSTGHDAARAAHIVIA